MRLTEFLNSYGSSIAVVREGDGISGAQLADDARRLACDIDALGAGSILLATEDAVTVVIGMAASEIAGVMLILSPGSLDEVSIQELIERHNIGAMVVDGDAGFSILPSSVIPKHESKNGFEVALMTSGTSGSRKLVRHASQSLMARIPSAKTSGRAWLLTYTPTAFAGLQVLLTALASSSVLVCTASREMNSILRLATNHKVTHASGTPTFWRAWLLASAGLSVLPPLQQITIGGEAVDQMTLDRLSAAYPEASIAHIYASTEAGVVFNVKDRREGFPASWLSTGVNGVELRIRNEVLELRTPRRMCSYLSQHAEPITDDGWLCTGDLVRISGDRVLFAGRQDKIVNIAGYKVLPEDIERTLLRVEGVLDAFVYPKSNVITGNVLLADITCHAAYKPDSVVAAAQNHLRRSLSRHQVPAAIRVVERVKTAESGKKQRY